MRLSWYGDTGVAVFSIWQGGRCTGTFRLPTGDLTRMIDTLRQGPAGQADPSHAEAARFDGPQRSADPLDGPQFDGPQFDGGPPTAAYESRPYGPGGSGQYDVPAARAGSHGAGAHGAGYEDDREPRGRRARLPGDPDPASYLSGPRTGSYAADFPAPPRGDSGGRDRGPRDPGDLPPAPRSSSRQQSAPHIRPEDPLGLGYQREEKSGYREPAPEYHAAPEYPPDYRGTPDYRPREGRDYPGGDYEYPESGGYREPAGYPEPSRYPEQPGYGTDPAPYGDSGGYREPGGYPDPGYREGGYPDGYAEPGYPEGEPRRRHGSRSARSEPRLGDPGPAAPGNSAAGLVPGFPEPGDRTDPGQAVPPGFDPAAPSPGRRARQP